MHVQRQNLKIIWLYLHTVAFQLSFLSTADAKTASILNYKKLCLNVLLYNCTSCPQPGNIGDLYTRQRVRLRLRIRLFGTTKLLTGVGKNLLAVFLFTMRNAIEVNI